MQSPAWYVGKNLAALKRKKVASQFKPMADTKFTVAEASKYVTLPPMSVTGGTVPAKH